jgi:hypothetical protein
MKEKWAKSTNDKSIMIDDLSSTITADDGTNENVSARINPPRFVFYQPKSIWNSLKLTRRAKVRISGSNINSKLLLETWKHDNLSQ